RLPSADRKPQIASGKMVTDMAKRAKKRKPPRNTSPIAQFQYLELAEEFFQAFLVLPPKGPSGIPVNWPRYFALCHAIELALKAFLLAHGRSNRQLMDIVFRHNISNLMAEAIRLGLNISKTARADIDLLTQAHQKYWPRYPDKRTGPVYIIDQF